MDKGLLDTPLLTAGNRGEKRERHAGGKPNESAATVANTALLFTDLDMKVQHLSMPTVAHTLFFSMQS